MRTPRFIKAFFFVLLILASVAILMVYYDSAATHEMVHSARSKLVSYLQVDDYKLQSLQMEENDTLPPGDMGQAVILEEPISLDVRKQIDDGWDMQGLNQYASDLVSVYRKLPDIRDQWCKEPGRFLPQLPPSSIVIIFYNEAWSVLVRTVQSVLNRTPPELIEEIILVDDCSTLAHLKTQLYDYFRPLKKVRIIRAKQRLGLIRARILGAQSAKAEIVTFLDAHCEVIVGWLEAQLDRVARDPKTIAIPSIDWIHEETMALNAQNSLLYFGSFDWTVNFQWKSRSEKKKKMENPLEPFETPVMAGGLFTINKTFFDHLGWYDDGLETYGAENMELSFKTWMCGGSMQIVPCSRVAHIQKRGHPYLSKAPGGYSKVKRNTIRVAEVWMDEYALFYYESFGGPKYRGDFGDVSARKKLRQQLNCKSFRWYMENVFPEQFDPSKAVGRGEFRSAVNGGTECLDWPPALDEHGVGVCHGRGGHQLWFFTADGELTREDHCMDYDGQKLDMIRCHKMKGNQLWEYDNKVTNFRHVYTNTCLEWSNHKLTVSECSESRKQQKWLIQYYNASNVKVA